MFECWESQCLYTINVDGMWGCGMVLGVVCWASWCRLAACRQLLVRAGCARMKRPFLARGKGSSALKAGGVPAQICACLHPKDGFRWHRPCGLRWAAIKADRSCHQSREQGRFQPTHPDCQLVAQRNDTAQEHGPIDA